MLMEDCNTAASELLASIVVPKETIVFGSTSMGVCMYLPICCDQVISPQRNQLRRRSLAGLS